MTPADLWRWLVNDLVGAGCCLAVVALIWLVWLVIMARIVLAIFGRDE